MRGATQEATLMVAMNSNSPAGIPQDEINRMVAHYIDRASLAAVLDAVKLALDSDPIAAENAGDDARDAAWDIIGLIDPIGGLIDADADLGAPFYDEDDDLRYDEDDDYREDHFRDDVEADADVLRMAGYGMDEDYNGDFFDDTPLGLEYADGFDDEG
jgi:hypothetical protein